MKVLLLEVGQHKLLQAVVNWTTSDQGANFWHDFYAANKWLTLATMAPTSEVG